MSGRVGLAPCGHPGECVVGNFYRCLQGCDAVAAKASPDIAILHVETGGEPVQAPTGWVTMRDERVRHNYFVTQRRQYRAAAFHVRSGPMPARCEDPDEGECLVRFEVSHFGVYQCMPIAEGVARFCRVYVDRRCVVQAPLRDVFGCDSLYLSYATGVEINLRFLVLP